MGLCTSENIWKNNVIDFKKSTFFPEFNQLCNGVAGGCENSEEDTRLKQQVAALVKLL